MIRSLCMAMLFIVTLTCSYSFAQFSPKITRDTDKVIKTLQEAGFLFHSSGDHYLSKGESVAVKYNFKSGHRFFIGAYVQDCASCDLRMQFVNNYGQTKEMKPNIERDGQHSAANYSFKQTENFDGSIEVYIEEFSSYNVRVLFFSRPY